MEKKNRKLKTFVICIIIVLISASNILGMGRNDEIENIVSCDDQFINILSNAPDFKCSHTTMDVEEDDIKYISRILSSRDFPTSGITHYVGGDGPGNYSTIQEAIDNASEGDTIFIYNGVYYEHIVIDKQLVVIGEDKQTTVIDGTGTDDVVSLEADGVIFKTVTIQNSGTGYGAFYTNSGLELTHAHYCEIQDCIFADNTAGIGICYSSYNLIEHCLFEGNNYGIRLFEDGEPPYDSCKGNIISKNLIQNNTGYGIACAHTIAYHRSNIIQCNTIKNNAGGIFLYVAKGNEIVYNTIINNTGFGVSIYSCMATSHLNLIHHNNFIDNNAGEVQASDVTFGTGINYWYLPQRELGNYWSDYSGYDSDDDGIGETPYEIPDEEGVTNQDEYPLMHQFVIGDMNVDGVVNEDDIEPFFLAVEDPEEYMDQYSIQPIIHGDIDQDGVLTNVDGGLFFSLLADPESWMPPENQPPFEPHNPFPVHYATDVNNYVELNWTGGDPDDVIVTYDVYFGETPSPPKVKSNQSDTMYDPGVLEYKTKYYWRVVAWDNHEVSTPGLLWTFETETGPVPSVVYVDDNYDSSIFGFGYDHFNRIQDGIDAVEEQGTVYVAPGIYAEEVLIDKPLNLIGEDKLTTILQSDAVDTVCTVIAENVMIRGFTITRSVHTYHSLKEIGVLISSDDIILSNCIISKHSTALSLQGEVTDVLIIENTFANNGYGILIDESCIANHIYHNNFLDNGIQAVDHGLNQWDDDYPSGGNYWDDYTGVDEDPEDGIGDTPYDIPGGANQDRYPLIELSEPTTVVFIDDDFDSSTPGWQVDHFNTVQEGADAVASHGIVYIGSGVYIEQVIIQKPLQIIGDDPASTLLAWDDIGDVITISGDDVTISRVTITHTSTVGKDNDAGIAIHSDSNVVVDTVITNNSIGILFVDDASDSMILDNSFENNGFGITIDSSCMDNQVFHNNFFANTLHAFDEGMNNWNDEHSSSGNYWDDFEDNPGYPDYYLIQGGSNKDNYPLMDISLSTTIFFVDNDYDDSTPGWESNHFDTVQDGVYFAGYYDIVFIYNGLYKEHFQIDKPLSLIGEDAENAIIDADQKYCDVIELISDHIHIKSITVQNSQAASGDAGIYIRSSDHTIADNIITNNCYGVTTYHSILEENIRFDNNVIHNNLDEGVYLNHCKNIIFINNTFRDNGDYGLQLGTTNDTVITGNSFYNDGLYMFKSYYLSIVDNTVNDKPLVYFEDASDEIVTDAGQVILNNCDSITVQNVQITNVNTGIHLLYSHDCSIVNSTLYNSDDGISLGWSSNCTISGNLFAFNDYALGVGRDSHDAKIIDNSFFQNMYGIRTYSSNNHVILENTLLRNYVYTSGTGIDLSNTQNCTVKGNTIIGFYDGVEMSNSNDNQFSHNNFLSNYNDVDTEEIQSWDEGYPSGGNYWDEFDSYAEGAYDYAHGIDQDIPGSDGIVDNPYQIPEIYNTDYYPLIHVFVLGDMNIDTILSEDDIEPFLLALTDPEEYMNQFEMHPLIQGDMNYDGILDESDYDVFLYHLIYDGNNPPLTPMNPYPSDGETITSFSGVSWASGDVDPFDTVTYDVYFGTTPLPPQVVANQSVTLYDPEDMLEPWTTYYWRVVAWDNHGVSTTGPLWSFTTAGLSWYARTVDFVGMVGMYSSMALDSDNYPHISYYDASNYDLKYTHWTGTEWIIETVDSTGNVGKSSSLSLDSNDRPHIAYFDDTGNDLKYASWTGSSWVIETVDTSCREYVSLALDSYDRPHIAYQSTFDLQYAKKIGSTWYIEEVDSGFLIGRYVSIAVDKFNLPHISYYDYDDGNLKYAKDTGTSWVIQTVDTGGGYSTAVGQYTSIALDSENQPHISYYDYEDYNLKYATWTGSSWEIETIDTGGAVGAYTSIAVDFNDQPHISYWDVSNQKAKYTTWTGYTWVIETVDFHGSNGKYTSIALDTSGTPHICYFDETFYDLRYAVKMS